METAAVPAERPWPGPFAAFALVVALAVPVLGLAVALPIGRKILGASATVGIAITTWLTLAFCFAVVGFTTLGSCDQQVPRYPWAILAAAGVAYVGVGLYALHARRPWGIPLAVVGAFTVGFVLFHALPTTSHYDPTACFH